jgi:hypothetical protein
MSPEFKVVIRGGDMRAMEALSGANFKTAGLPLDTAGEKPLDHELADEIQVILRANDPGQAQERVQQVLPEGDYTIARVIPVDED